MIGGTSSRVIDCTTLLIVQGLWEGVVFMQSQYSIVENGSQAAKNNFKACVIFAAQVQVSGAGPLCVLSFCILQAHFNGNGLGGGSGDL